MIKGLLIMLLVFGLVGILGWGAMKIGNAPEAKKKRYRKYFWGFYGFFLLVQGVVMIWEDGNWFWFSTLNIALGLILLWAAIFGKFDAPEKSDT